MSQHGAAELLAFGISHKTAPVAVRERLALTTRDAARLVQELVARPSIHEAVAISTCNRTEVYLVTDDQVQAEADLLGFLARRAGIRPTELAGVVYSPRNCDAARQLYRVVGGLESMVVGETEVQGQVKRAYEAALEAGTTGPLTNRLFTAALQTGKRIRTETALGSSRTSVASVAVDLASQVVGDLARRDVIIIGAGETSETTAKALAGRGVRTIFVANRHAARAHSMAARVGGRVSSLHDLPELLDTADMVVASTSSPHAIVEAEEVEAVMRRRSDRPLVLIDIAVPRDIDPACADVPGVTLYDIDDLQAVVARNLDVREGDRERAEAIVEDEIQRFARWLAQMDVRPTVAELREHGARIVDHVLSENAGRWESASPKDLARVDAIARAVMQRLLHEPTARLKALPPESGHGRLQVARELFGLEGGSDAGGPDAVEELDRPARRTADPRAPPVLVRLGTRGSALALAQARWVAERLAGDVEVVPITTTGDRDRAREDKAKWVRELERALLAQEVDLAVHSAKDVPSALPDGLVLAGAPEREDPRDVLVGRLAGRVGTSSPRRAAMLRAFHPAVEVVEVRGNVDTRLRKLASGQLDGLVLAAAGLRRLGRAEPAAPLDFVPAAGQGTLLLEARAGTAPVLRDPAAWSAVTCERACVRALEADCHSAVGIHHDGTLLRGWVGSEDGSAWIADALEGPASEELGLRLAERLLAAGAGDLL